MNYEIVPDVENPHLKLIVGDENGIVNGECSCSLVYLQRIT